MLKPTTKPVVGTFLKETAAVFIARNIKTLLSLLALLAAGVVGWMLG